VRDLVYKLLVNEDPKVVAAARSLFDGLSDEVAVAMFLPQMSFLGLGQGLAVEVNKPVSYEDSLPNPLGGPAITAPSVLTLESYDPRTQQADVVWTQALDPQSMAASMKVSVRWLLERMNAANDAAKVEAAMRDTSMSRESRCRFVIDGGSGLARKADCSAVIEIAAQGQRSRRTDTWTITQTLPEKR
jgi:hypothetical protein